MIQYIEGKMLRDMFVSGANNLQNHKELVDKLNVFPVPDGDTGTNMSLTISYAMKELAKVENDSINRILEHSNVIVYGLNQKLKTIDNFIGQK